LATPGPALVLLSGYPGAGKSTFARAIRAALDGVVVVESDAVRRELFPTPRYIPPEHERVFREVERRARVALEGGQVAVIDATNLTTRDRARFIRLAKRQAMPAVAVRLVAPWAVLEARIAGPRDGFSQATVSVLEGMWGRAQPFSIPVVVADSRYPFGPSLALLRRLLEDRR
jgi:predicted kinase